MSQLTLFDLSLRVARNLGVLVEGTATGGSTSTVVDNPSRNEVDNYWGPKGTVWITYDAGGSAAAPQGEYAEVTASTSTTWTLTSAASSFTAAVAVGDQYAVARAFGTDCWRDILRQKINNSLMELGPIEVTDTTSLITVADQTEYSLPIAANQDLRQVWIQTDSTDSNANYWEPLYNYYQQKSATGIADLLVFNRQLPYPYALKLVYVAPHPELRLASSKLSERVPEQLVVWPATRDAFRHLRDATHLDKWDRQIAEWEQKVEVMRQRVRLQLPRRSPKFMVLPNRDLYVVDETVGKVRL